MAFSSFCLCGRQTDLPLNLLSLKKPVSDIFNTTVHNYKTIKVSFLNLLSQPSATLLNFGKCSLESTLNLEIDQHTYPLILHRRKRLKDFIGFQEDSYNLILPECYHEDLGMYLAFDNQKIIPVKVREKEGKVWIDSLYWWPSFSFIFERIDN